jgi:hypothetical protein
MTNQELALALRQVSKAHEASWDTFKAKYNRSMHDCIRAELGNDPLALIFDCLFTAGYAEMWSFCDQVLETAPLTKE